MRARACVCSVTLGVRVCALGYVGDVIYSVLM